MELEAYRSRRADIKKHDAQILAISSDTAAEQKKFKSELKVDFPFIPDTDRRIIDLYGVRGPGIGWALRRTFVIGPDQKVVHVDNGGKAMNPSTAIASCPVHKPAAQ